MLLRILCLNSHPPILAPPLWRKPKVLLPHRWLSGPMDYKLFFWRVSKRCGSFIHPLFHFMQLTVTELLSDEKKYRRQRIWLRQHNSVSKCTQPTWNISLWHVTSTWNIQINSRTVKDTADPHSPITSEVTFRSWNFSGAVLANRASYRNWRGSSESQALIGVGGGGGREKKKKASKP
jgi:hypothetical protein